MLGIVEQGLIYGLLSLGLLISYRILDFPDLTVDASFPLGAAVSAVLTVKGVPPAATLPAAMLAGALAGAVTGLIHVKGHVRDLLASIITMTALYSVNLFIAGLSSYVPGQKLSQVAGKASVPLFSGETLFKNAFLKAAPAWLSPYTTALTLLALALMMKCLIDWFLRTKAGFLLVAAGDNPALVETLGKSVGGVKIEGLMIANALVALSGAVLCQQQRNFDISMGTGAMVMGLASVIIGLNLFGRLPRVKMTTAAVLGAIVYKACVSLAMRLGLSAFWLKGVTAALFLCVLVLSRFKKGKAAKDA